MKAADLLASAQLAAEALAQVEAPGTYRHIQLGAGLPREVVDELAKLAGVEVAQHDSYSAASQRTYRIRVARFSHAGIEISGQSDERIR